MMDLAILGVQILDGTGRPAFMADIGIKAGRIVRIGKIEKGAAVKDIMSAGRVVCPGFIDTHSHSDVMALAEPELLPKLMQGITTELLGQDGIAAAPLHPTWIDQWRQYMAGLAGDPPIHWDWQTIGQYAARLDAARPGPNLAFLAPLGNIRLVILGMENVRADEKSLRAMEAEVTRALEEGAAGISLGLVYTPCTFFQAEELERLCRIAAGLDGFLVVHIRSGGNLLLEAIGEMICLASATGIPLHISHFKASGRRNWEKMERALEAVDEANRQGLDVTFDIYPYTAASTMFLAVLPPWALEGGIQDTLRRLQDPSDRDRMRDQILNPPPPDLSAPGWDNTANLAGWENVIVSSVGSGKNQSWVGRSVAAIARDSGRDACETAFDILLEEEGRVGMVTFVMSEEKVIKGLVHPRGMICTDGLLGGKPHPRVYGSFPRVLGLYVRERKELSLAEAVRKMTSLPAARIKLRDRGTIAEGMAADLLVFNAGTVLDRATYEDPRQFPTGIDHVIVNGIHSVEEGRFTGERGGVVLRKERRQAK